MGRNKGSKNKITLDRIKLKQQELLKLNEDYTKQLENIKTKKIQTEQAEQIQRPPELTKKEVDIKDNSTYKEYTLNENYTEPKKENNEIIIEKKNDSGSVQKIEKEKVLPKKENVKPKPKSKYLFE